MSLGRWLVLPLALARASESSDNSEISTTPGTTNRSLWIIDPQDPFITDWRERVVNEFGQCRAGLVYPGTSNNDELHHDLSSWEFLRRGRQCEGTCEIYYPGCTIRKNATTNETIEDDSLGNCTEDSWPVAVSHWTCPYRHTATSAVGDVTVDGNFLKCGCQFCPCAPGRAGPHCEMCTSDEGCAAGVGCNTNARLSPMVSRMWQCSPTMEFLTGATYKLAFAEGLVNFEFHVKWDADNSVVHLDAINNWCSRGQPLLMQAVCPCKVVSEERDAISGNVNDNECLQEGVPAPCTICRASDGDKCSVSFPEGAGVTLLTQTLLAAVFEAEVVFGCDETGLCKGKAGDAFIVDNHCTQGLCTDAVEVDLSKRTSLLDALLSWSWLTLAFMVLAFLAAVTVALWTTLVVVRRRRLAATSPVDRPPALLDQHGFTFSWSGITCRRGGQNVLKGVGNSVTAMPDKGALLALTGPSGCGKTTLLDVLAGRMAKAGDMGEVLLDGRPLSLQARRDLVGYVSQELTLSAGMTVRQALEFSAALRLVDFSPARRAGRITWVLQELGLERVSDSPVGSVEGRGISGGERRRVAIGLELLVDCPVMVLDEPTTGLDAAISLELGKTLAHVASLGRVIISSLHQPRPELLKLFHARIRLDRGRVVDGGADESFDLQPRLAPIQSAALTDAAENSLGHHERTPLEDAATNSAENRATTTLTSVTVALGEAPPAAPAAEANQAHHLTVSENGQAHLAVPEKTVEAGSPMKPMKRLAVGRSRRCWPTQVLALWERSLTNWRDLYLPAGQAAFVVTMGVLYGLLFADVSTDFEGVQERLGSIMFTLLFFSYGSLQICVSWHQDRARMGHENASGHYTISAYYVSKMTSYIFFQCVILPVLFVVSSYWIVGYNTDSIGRVLVFVLGLCGTIAAMSAAALLCSSFFRDVASGVGMAATVITLFILYGGAMRPKASIPWPFKLLTHMSPFTHAFEAMAINELSGLVSDVEGVQVLGETWLWQWDIDTNAGAGPPMRRLGACVLAYWAAAFIPVFFQLYSFDYSLLVQAACHRQAIADSAASQEIARAAALAGDGEQIPMVQVKVKRLSWRGIVVKLPGGRSLLETCEGHADLGMPLAVLGPSGAGKTSLLGLLAGDSIAARGFGDVRLDGQQVAPTTLRRLACYTRQEETLLPLSTVRESCLFSAALHLGDRDASWRRRHVAWLLTELGLDKVADARIGGERKRGISGGERRRTAIAVELLAPRPLLLLDEPTSGLDGDSAMRVGKLLTRFSSNGRIVVSTLHQPKQDLLQHFSQILALAPGGDVAFMGSFQQIRDALKDASLFLPPEGTVNLADVLLDGVHRQGTRDLLVRLHSKKSRVGVPATPNLPLRPDEIRRPSLPPLSRQLSQVLRRELQTSWREPTMIFNSYFSAIVAAVVLGLTYRPLALNLEGMIARLGLFCSSVWLIAMNALVCIVAWREGHLAFLREHNSGMYSASVYSVCKGLVDTLVLRIGPPFIYGTILMPVAGLKFEGHGSSAVFLLVIFSLTSIASAMFSFAVGAMAPRSQWTLPVAAFLMLIHVLFSGLFIPTPPAIFTYLSFARASYNALVSSELAGLTFRTDPKGLEELGGTLADVSGDRWLDILQLENNSARHVIQLVCHIGFYALASCAILTLQAQGRTRFGAASKNAANSNAPSEETEGKRESLPPTSADPPQTPAGP